MQANSGDPDNMLHSAVSGLGLHHLPTSHKKDARLIWVKHFFLYFLTNPYVVGTQKTCFF